MLWQCGRVKGGYLYILWEATNLALKTWNTQPIKHPQPKPTIRTMEPEIQVTSFKFESQVNFLKMEKASCMDIDWHTKFEQMMSDQLCSIVGQECDREKHTVRGAYRHKNMMKISSNWRFHNSCNVQMSIYIVIPSPQKNSTHFIDPSALRVINSKNDTKQSTRAASHLDFFPICFIDLRVFHSSIHCLL